MKPIPRILPLIGVAAGGVLAINALSGARELPDLISGAKAYAEGAAKPDKAGKEAAATGNATDAGASGMPSLTSAAKPPPVCAPTAAELAKEAGLSPAELQVLQSLGARRGQLDQRENDLNTQLALMAAAEAKLDAKVKALTGLKSEIQGLLTQTDQKEAAEVDRLVKVFEGMKPKDAAPRMVLLDDAVRLPIAAKMKERSLSGILALMPPAEAKKLTESLAKRFTDARSMAANAAATATQAANQVATPAPLTPDPVESSGKAAKPAQGKAPGKQAQKADAPSAKAAPTAPAAPKAG
ncbi:MotE family protein [Phenylobacterium sp. LjRoot225]|uniref:MotE family protein n=1 Tax=Phenylobacterium sp. LjRoot225 TaxID=3342285 RepID=UPI003ECD21BE